MRLLVKAGFVGPYTMDFQNLNGVLVQVKEGALRGLRREKEGWPGSQKEIVDHVSTYAVALNVSNDFATTVVTLTNQITQVRALKEWAEALALAATATEVILEDRREGMVKALVAGIRDAINREDPTLEVLFAKTLRYYGQYGAQAAKTRAENAEAAEAEAEAEAEEAEAETGTSEEAAAAADSGPESKAA